MEQFTTREKTQITKEQKAGEYIIRYLGELKLHFNLSDDDIRKILSDTCIKMRGKGIVSRWINMLKSFLRDFKQD